MCAANINSDNYPFPFGIDLDQMDGLNIYNFMDADPDEDNLYEEDDENSG